MNLVERIESLKAKEAEVNKLREELARSPLAMQLVQKDGEHKAEMRAFLQELQLPETFGLLDAIQKAYEYRSGLITNV